GKRTALPDRLGSHGRESRKPGRARLGPASVSSDRPRATPGVRRPGKPGLARRGRPAARGPGERGGRRSGQAGGPPAGGRQGAGLATAALPWTQAPEGRGPGRLAGPRLAPELYAHIKCLRVSVNLQRDVVSGLLARDAGLELVGARNRLAVELRDHVASERVALAVDDDLVVAPAEPGPSGRALGNDPLDQDAVTGRHPERARQRRIDVRHLDAEVCMLDPAVGDELGGDLLHGEIRRRIAADDSRLQAVTAREVDLDLLGALDDVVVRDDVAGLVDDEARAEGLLHLRSEERVRLDHGGRGDLHDAGCSRLVDLLDRLPVR